MNSVSEYINTGHSLTFTKNMVIMRWESYEKEAVVDSLMLASDGSDNLLLGVLEHLKRAIDRQIISRRQRRRPVVCASNRCSDTDEPIFI